MTADQHEVIVKRRQHLDYLAQSEQRGLLRGEGVLLGRGHEHASDLEALEADEDFPKHLGLLVATMWVGVEIEIDLDGVGNAVAIDAGGAGQ